MLINKNKSLGLVLV